MAKDEQAENMDFASMLGYALPALILAPMAISFYVFLPKLFADLGTVSIQAVGIALLATRVFDAVTDPIIGFLSDRTSDPRTHRKFWMKYSLLPLCLCFILLFFVSSVPSSWHLIWFIIFSIGFFLFWTTYSIPYEAMGQGLLQDYDRRTALFSVRDGAIVIGTVGAAALPLALETLLPTISVANRWLLIVTLYSLLLVIFTHYCTRIVSPRLDKHKSPTPSHPSLRDALIPSLHSTLSNTHFRKLLAAYTVYSLGAALPATLFLFYVERVLESNRGLAFLTIYFVVGLFTLPAWQRISQRFSKKRAWLAALLLNTGGFLGVFFLSAGDELYYLVLVAISGLGYGASLALPSAMQADVIDFEELQTGLRKEGEFLGVWSVAKKLSAAVGAGMALWILGAVGFDPSVVDQSPQAVLALKVLYCLIPCCCSFASIWIIRDYSLNRTEHASVALALAERRRQFNSFNEDMVNA